MLSTKWPVFVGFLLTCAMCTLQAQSAAPATETEASTDDPEEKAEAEDSGPDEVTDEAAAENNDEPAGTETVPEPQPTAEEIAAREKAAAEKRAAEAEDARLAELKRREEQRSGLEKLAANSQFYTGIYAGGVLPMNSLHKAGYGFGMSLDYVAYQKYGLHLGAETGMLPAKAGNLPAGTNTIHILEGGSFGYLNLRLAAMYALPAIAGIEPFVGLGVAYYALNGGTYRFAPALAPIALATAWYTLLPQLQVGAMLQVVVTSSSTVISAASEYALDDSQSLSSMSLHLAMRYKWF